MKKTITFIRHARSSWDNSSLWDMHRPLSARWELEATHMKDMLPVLGFEPEKVLCSEALRAKQTCKILIPEIYNSDIFCIDEHIYPLFCSSTKSYDNQAILKYLKKILNTYDRACIVWHNDGLNAIIGYLIWKSAIDMPTCSLARIQFQEKDIWKMTQWCAILDLFIHNKQFINSISKDPDTY